MDKLIDSLAFLLYWLYCNHIAANRRGGVKVERSTRVWETGVRIPVATDLTRVWETGVRIPDATDLIRKNR